ncbi:hypothetical protein ACVW00_003481 [Marmoricola sp. URHA0025 HA25]
MKSVFTRSAVGRRAAAGTVLTLAAATLSLGVAGSASAISTIDLQGTVTGVGGTPLEGIHVEVYDAATGDSVETVHSDALGHYEFDDLVAGQYKVWVEDHNTFDYADTTYYLDRWYGGTRSIGTATPVTVVADSDGTLNLPLTQAGIVTGTLSAPDGHEFTDGWDLDVFTSDLRVANYTVATSGINFKVATDPGSVRIGGDGWDSNVTGPDTYYLETWWSGADTPAAATPITVASGQTVSGINLRPTNVLTARQAPQISGVAAVGRVLTAKPGTWARNAGTEFSYTWKRGTTVVGTGATYTPTVADFGSRLVVDVRAVNTDTDFNGPAVQNAGEAVSLQTDVVRYPADAKGTAKAFAGHKVRFGVKIVSAKQSPVKGKVVVMRGTKVVHKAVKLVKGKAVILVNGQPKGKQVYTVLYKGNSLLAKATKTFTVRVR